MTVKYMATFSVISFNLTQKGKERLDYFQPIAPGQPARHMTKLAPPPPKKKTECCFFQMCCYACDSVSWAAFGGFSLNRTNVISKHVQQGQRPPPKKARGLQIWKDLVGKCSCRYRMELKNVAYVMSHDTVCHCVQPFTAWMNAEKSSHFIFKC